MIVVDASALAVALADDGPEGERARARLAGEQIFVPDLVDAELVSILRRACTMGALSEERAALAVDDLRDLPVRRVPTAGYARSLWRSAGRWGVAEAAYLHLAEALDAPLLTADRRIADAPAATCTVEVVG